MIIKLNLNLNLSSRRLYYQSVGALNDKAKPLLTSAIAVGDVQELAWSGLYFFKVELSCSINSPDGRALAGCRRQGSRKSEAAAS